MPLRTLALPEEVEHWSLTTLREKLVKIGARIVRHGRYFVFQLAEVAVPRALFADPTGEVRPRSHKLATKQRAVGSPCRGSAATTQPRPLSAFACCLMLPMGAFWPWYRRYLGNVGLI